jgi:NADH-quinone oxidoreductase subunit G
MSETPTSQLPDTEVTPEEEAAVPELPGVAMTIDGRSHRATPGQLVIDACEDAGVYVPRFCYHHRMDPVGMCRQCLVEVDGPRGPMLVVSCMTTVAEGQVVHTQSDTVKRAQEGVLELLLANHPLDCPVCDKGGECPLQDQAMTHGPGESRYVEEKRHYAKPIPISDLVLLDRERCILCDRCTRFAEEVAGDPLISFTQRGNATQVNTFPDHPFASYFSGNTVQICPVGALTATPYRFKARPWDLEQRESTCTTCAVGCRTVVQSSRDELVRYQGLDSDAVNWGWLCDRGRFGFQATNSEDRLTHPMVRTADGHAPTTWGAAISATADLVRRALDERGPAGVAILGGARGTNESAFAWSRLARALGVDQLDAQLGDGLPASVFELPQATIADAASAATVVLLGPDLKEELPVLYLRLRDAAERRRTRIVELAPMATGLSPYAWISEPTLPGTQAPTVRSVLSRPEVAEQLGAGPVVVVAGRSNLAEAPEHVMAAIDEVLAVVPAATVLPVLRRANVRGALAAGLAPAPGGDGALGILRAAAEGRIGCLVLLGADPLADVPDAELARRALAGAGALVAVDTFLTASSGLADVVLPAAMAGEQDGSTTNLEGRVSPVAQKVTVTGTARPDWMIAVELAAALGHDLGIESVADAQAGLASTVPAFAPVTATTMAAARDGVLLARPTGRRVPVDAPAVPALSGYGHRLVVSRTLYDQAVGTVHSPSLAKLAGGATVHVHPLDCERLGVTTGTEVKVTGTQTSVVLGVVADARVPRGTAWAPFNRPGADVRVLLDGSASVVDVRLESL